MSAPEVTWEAVVIVLGPGAEDDLVDHARRVLRHYGIQFQDVGWSDFQDRILAGTNGLRVIIFATGISHTVEHIVLDPYSAPLDAMVAGGFLAAATILRANFGPVVSGPIFAGNGCLTARL